MNFFLAGALLSIWGMDAGWQPHPQGGMTYILQLNAADLEALQQGMAIEAKIPPQLRDLRWYRVVAGNAELPRKLLPAEAETPATPPTLPSVLGPDIKPGGASAIPGMRPIGDDAPVPPPSAYTPPMPYKPPLEHSPTDVQPPVLPTDTRPPLHNSDPSPAPSPMPAPTKPAAMKTTPIEVPFVPTRSATAALPATLPAAVPAALPATSAPASSNEKPGPSPEPSPEPSRPWLTLTLALLALFASLGFNGFQGWIYWDLQQRHRALLAKKTKPANA